jgi:RNA polymerase sigma-70 factor (ECF subfamily)
LVNKRNPLAEPEEMIRRVYSFAAYRVGPGPDAEDITSDTMLRAVRYRSSYDPAKGQPLSWLLGIARGCVDDFFAARAQTAERREEEAAPQELEEEIVQRLSLADAVSRLDERDRELIALRYGADLSTKQISELLGLSRNAVDVALHRCRERLSVELRHEGFGAAERRGVRRSRPATERGT